MAKNSFLSGAVIAFLLAGFIGYQQTKPNIFLMGDSISIQYGPYLIKDLEGVANVDQKNVETLQGKEFSRNGGDSKRLLDYTTAKLQQQGFNPDYIILNCGLHDIGRDTIKHELQIPAEEYRANLEKIFSMIRKKKIRMIWVTTTPVVDSIHNSRIKEKQRYAADVENFNRIAKEICIKFKVDQVDLHDFTKTLGTTAYIDNVHYKEEIRTLQAAYIAGAVRVILNKEKQTN